MAEQQICQWCFNEIIWDEEIGPESHCPHCDNELGKYRTMELGANEEEAQYEQAKQAQREVDYDDWDEEDSSSELRAEDKNWLRENDGGYRTSNRRWIAAEGVIQQIIDEQEEAPECPACREYMLEAGTQTVGAEGFKPTVAPAIKGSIIPVPFEVKWYICPACFHTSTQLSAEDRNAMVKRLAPTE